MAILNVHSDQCGQRLHFVDCICEVLQSFPTALQFLPNLQSAVEKQILFHGHPVVFERCIYQPHAQLPLQDREMTCNFLKSAVPIGAVRFGTGYFNPTKEYLDIILNGSKASYDVLVRKVNIRLLQFGRKGPGIPRPRPDAVIFTQTKRQRPSKGTDLISLLKSRHFMIQSLHKCLTNLLKAALNLLYRLRDSRASHRT